MHRPRSGQERIVCGICGICLESSDEVVDREVLQRMTDTLTHRGPDADGIHTDNNVGLGHRRLSIIDLDGGDQPIYSEDGSIAIIFNGEIYNYKEIRRELLNRGHRFRTHSDTEVIIHLYEEKGVDCLADLNGMFAFAIWDANDRTLFMARDRLGEKPLYYTLVNGSLVFGSELKAITRGPHVSPAIDVDALDDYLAYGYVPAPRTIYSDIKKLQPAHYMLWSAGRAVVRRYWSPPPPSNGAGLSIEAYRERLGALLSESIALRLRSDVPVGAFLSGGVDSSLVVALASQHAGKALETFSVKFDEAEFDESNYARVLAKHFQTTHHEINVGALDLSMFPQLVEHFDEPFADPSAVPTFFVSREARRFVKVCLSGDAGDELFGGYPQYQWEPCEQHMDWLPSSLRASVLGLASNVVPTHMNGKGWLRRMSVSGARRFQRKVGVFDCIERRQLFRPEFHKHVDSGAWLFESIEADPNADEITRRMAIDQGTFLPEDILVKVDRTSMLNSLEVRVPFLDHRVVEFANTLPLSAKIRGGVQKYLLRSLLGAVAPRDIAERGKQGFGLPIKHWLRDRYYAFSRDMLLSRDSRSNRFFDVKQMGHLITAHKRGRRDLSGRIWALLWFEQWCRANAM